MKKYRKTETDEFIRIYKNYFLGRNIRYTKIAFTKAVLAKLPGPLDLKTNEFNKNFSLSVFFIYFRG